ncbi:MAG: hypothetical protein LUD52_02790, partial [Opitutae bacterium]|nr:hypothetical protein [Opitutae bacterium]
TTLYTTSIFIVDKKTGNSTNSARAPEAFADEDGKIPFEASGWLCYYEGWFGVPETGMYRFVGMADDAMAVGVDKKTVLYAFYPREGHGPAVNFVTGWEPNNCCGVGGNDGLELSLSGVGQRKTLYKGSWLRLDANRRYRIQVIFGEAYGGLAGATLGIQKYGEDNDNNFPLFTLEKMEPDPDLKIDETGMYNTSAVFRALK